MGINLCKFINTCTVPPGVTLILPHSFTEITPQVTPQVSEQVEIMDRTAITLEFCRSPKSFSPGDGGGQFDSLVCIKAILAYLSPIFYSFFNFLHILSNFSAKGSKNSSPLYNSGEGSFSSRDSAIGFILS